MDYVFFLANIEIRRNTTKPSKCDDQFYSDHAWERTHHLKNKLKKLYLSLANFGQKRENSVFAAQNCAREN
ncbi:MAG: hypothetical protein JJ858_18095 [Rhizobiaceae bacterium]|nr:hypothetical protein [Rhizobiaceae bacterium]